MKKVYLFILVFISLLFLFITIPAKADSGWDSSYDSGGSSSDSSWSSSSSSGSSSHNHSSSYSAFGIAVLIFAYCFFLYLITRKNGISVGCIYCDVSEEIFDNFGLEKETLKNELFSKFIDIQNAWMEFDYDKLNQLCTDELYNSYKSQLEVLKVKNGKNIMSDFELLNTKVLEIKEEGSQIIVNVYMKISFYDYVIDTVTGNVTRGTDANKITNNYIMTFVKSKVDSNNLVNCPNCNAEVHVNASGRCEYCSSVLVKDAGEFVLSKKENTNR